MKFCNVLNGARPTNTCKFVSNKHLWPQLSSGESIPKRRVITDRPLEVFYPIDPCLFNKGWPHSKKGIISDEIIDRIPPNETDRFKRVLRLGLERA